MALKENRDYIFTLEEIGEHIGLGVKNHSLGYRAINHALELLENSGLISYVSYFDGISKKKKLIAFNFEYRRKDKI